MDAYAHVTRAECITKHKGN